MKWIERIYQSHKSETELRKDPEKEVEQLHNALQEVPVDSRELVMGYSLDLALALEKRGFVDGFKYAINIIMECRRSENK